MPQWYAIRLIVMQTSLFNLVTIQGILRVPLLTYENDWCVISNKITLIGTSIIMCCDLRQQSLVTNANARVL